MIDNDKPTLSFGKYTIEISKGPSVIYKIDEDNNKQWICSAPDPVIAQDIVEGLVMVELKRFHYPDALPTVKTSIKTEVSNIRPPFLNSNT